MLGISIQTDRQSYYHWSCTSQSQSPVTRCLHCVTVPHQETSPNCLGQRSPLTSMLPNPRTTVAAFMSAPHLCLPGGICPFPTPHNLVGLSAHMDPSSSRGEGILTPKEGIRENKMSPRKGGLALFSLGLPVLRTIELLM